MPTVVNISLNSSPVAVSIVSAPVTAAVSVATSPVTAAVSFLQISAPITLQVSAARDAYQLALAEGFVGSRAEWLASLQGEAGPAGAAGDTGPAGANAEIVVLSLAAYLALDAETQMDGTWYVIPKS